MTRLQLDPGLDRLCLLSAVATPVLAFGSQIAAAPFYPGYSFSLQSGSMLGTHFSLHPWIFNLGEMLTGLAYLAAGLGLYRAFRGRTHLLVSWLVGMVVASAGVLSLKAGLFPMPDPRHNSWGLVFGFTILTPYLLLIGLWGQSDSRGLRIYLLATIVLQIVLVPMIPWLERGVAQRLVAATIVLPVGVVGFFLWRDLHHARDTLEPENPISIDQSIAKSQTSMLTNYSCDRIRPE